MPIIPNHTDHTNYSSLESSTKESGASGSRSAEASTNTHPKNEAVSEEHSSFTLISESNFADWDNDEDSVYDDL
jgi:hypothetical protein